MECGISFNQSFTFDQLSNGQTQVQNLLLRRNHGGEKNCTMDLVVDVEVD